MSKEKQLEFENSFESLDELIDEEVLEQSMYDDEEANDFELKSYNEVKFDDEGNLVKNFLGHDK